MVEDRVNAKLLLLSAATSVASGDIEGLRTHIVADKSVLNANTCLDLLLRFLPESIEPDEYIPLVEELYEDRVESADNAVKLTDGVSGLGDRTATTLLNKLDLSVQAQESDILLTDWFKQRAIRIQRETGLIELSHSLLTSSRLASQEVRQWDESIVEVLYCLYRQYPNSPFYNIEEFEALPYSNAIELLLSGSNPSNISWDMRTIVVPYMKYESKDWSVVWEWLLKKSETYFLLLSRLVASWDGPDQGTELYMRTALAACYLTAETSGKVWDEMHKIQQRVKHIMPTSISDPIDETSLSLTNFKDPRCPLTQSFSSSALETLDLLITSAAIMFPHTPLSLQAVARIKYFASEDEQKVILLRFLRSGNWQSQNETNWKSTRDNLKWLQSKSGVLAKLSPEYLESTICATMLAAGQFSLVKQIYVDMRTLIPLDQLVKNVLDSFLDFFDNATNGNCTRGSMRSAAQCLRILPNTLSTTPQVVRANLLLTSVHALSHYSLTLTPGVPLLPVQLRMYETPVDLIRRIFELNRGSYKKVDQILDIAHDLFAGTGRIPQNSKKTEAGIVCMAIDAALAEGDFEIAYAYCMDRLLGLEESEVTWAAFYNAGKWDRTSSISSKAFLPKHLYLLSHAVRLCPPPMIAQVLGVWQDREKQMNIMNEENIHKDDNWSLGSLIGALPFKRAEYDTNTGKTALDWIAR